MKCFETFVAFCLFFPLTCPWEGSSNVCSVKWRSFLKLSSGASDTLVFTGRELTCWWKEPRVQNTPLCLVTGSCGHMAGWCDVIFPLAIAYLPCHDNGHRADEHQVTVTDQNAAGLAVLGAFYNVDALSGWSTWWLIVWWSWLSEQYVWVKVPQACSHQGGNTKGIFNLLIFIEVFLV